VQKVIDWINIGAACREVFETVVDFERRMQLSPLRGLNRLVDVSHDFPQAQSRYRVQILTGAQSGIAGGISNMVQSAFAGLTQVMILELGQAASNSDVWPDKETAFSASGWLSPARWVEVDFGC
jgi:hypothetical protein